MKNQHLIALDLDGTLLRDDKTISEKTKNVLKQVRKEGHIVMISTGRPFRSSSKYYEELELDTPIVNFNGAFVHHPLDKDWGTFHEPLPIGTAREVIDICFAHSFTNIVAEVLDHVFIHYHDEKLLEIFMMGNPTITSGDLRNFLKADPTSLLIQVNPESSKKIMEITQDTDANVIEHRNWAMGYRFLEVVKQGINKATGIDRVAKYYNIPQERIIAFGDENNDLEMLQYAKYGIAMGNGIKDVKEIAYDVTKTNEEDGVAYYLEKLLLS